MAATRTAHRDTDTTGDLPGGTLPPVARGKLIAEQRPGRDQYGPLMTQGEARAEANRLRARGVPCVAATVPLSCWGGQEEGWTVYLGDPYACAPPRRRRAT
jgi:hypothetical protein